MSYQVLAPMAGSIWKIEVTEGDPVNETSVLIVMESMKMEVPVTAPVAGRVASIAVAEGASVQEDDLLLVLDSK